MKTARILGAITALALAATGLLAGSAAQGAQWDGPDPAMKPVKALWGGATGLEAPGGIAFDDTGYMYVANMLDKSVTVYAPDWAAGNTAPVKTLKGPSTLLIMPVAIAFDDEQRMYVLNSDSVTVYAADWKDGDNTPLKILRGGGTGILSPRGLAFDSTGRMYVTNSFEIVNIRRGSVTVYADEWPSGNTEPVATLIGNSTGLVRPTGLTFDQDGYMYVAQGYGVSVFEPGWDTGDTAPVRVNAGPGSGMDDPRSIIIDDAGYMYVANNGRGLISRPHIAVYEPDWRTGTTPPSVLIFGVNSLLTDPYGMAMDDQGRLYVTNQIQDSVTVYQTQYLTLDPLSSVPWNTPTVTASASSSGGLPTTITTTTPDVCSGSGTSPITITIKAMGTCALEVTQEGDERLAPAPAITGSFQVTTAPQTITVSGPTSVSLSKKWTRVKASTTSGLPVVWTSETPDVCLHKRSFGQRVQLKATGTCTLSAYQRGNSLWDSAGPETVSFEVTP